MAFSGDALTTPTYISVITSMITGPWTRSACRPITSPATCQSSLLREARGPLDVKYQLQSLAVANSEHRTVRLTCLSGAATRDMIENTWYTSEAALTIIKVKPLHFCKL